MITSPWLPDAFVRNASIGADVRATNKLESLHTQSVVVGLPCDPLSVACRDSSTCVFASWPFRDPLGLLPRAPDAEAKRADSVPNAMEVRRPVEEVTITAQ